MIEAAMSKVAGTPPEALEVRRFRWRIVPALVLFMVGGLLGIAGVIALSVVLYHAIRNSWSGVAGVDLTVMQWLPVLLLSYVLMLVSGMALIAAAYWCGMGRWWATVIALLLGVAVYGCFSLLFPGPVPL